MTDIYVILGSGGAAMVIIIGFWLLLSRRGKKGDRAVKVMPDFTAKIPMPTGARPPAKKVYLRPSYEYNPVVSVVETNSGFSEGLVIGSMLSASDTETATPVEIPTFSGFGGGDSGGGGATSNWDPPSDSCSVDTSSSDSSSCSDSSSSSSGDS